MKRWKAAASAGEAVDVLATMLTATMDVLGVAAFGHRFNSTSAEVAEDAPLYTAFNTILQVLARRGSSSRTR